MSFHFMRQHRSATSVRCVVIAAVPIGLQSRRRRNDRANFGRTVIVVLRARLTPV